MQRGAILAGFLGTCLCFAAYSVAQEPNPSPAAPATDSLAKPGSSAGASLVAPSSHAVPANSSSKTEAAPESALRVEGEKRFRTNCGRCHMAPHRFPPRVMATAIRHMRVRATLTDEDMRIILHYMTQ
jgi:mono/diheme cytochrome c family protein